MILDTHTIIGSTGSKAISDKYSVLPEIFVFWFQCLLLSTKLGVFITLLALFVTRKWIKRPNFMRSIWNLCARNVMISFLGNSAVGCARPMKLHPRRPLHNISLLACSAKSVRIVRKSYKTSHITSIRNINVIIVE